jgi:ATP-dependent DNA ligase
MTRYFPEILGPLRASLPERCVVDGEIVIAGPRGLDFDALLNRIHPAASRVRKLAEETPASFVAFDLLAIGDEDLRPLPFEERRRRLEQALAGTKPPIYLTPASRDRAVAEEWFRRFEGAGLDGVMVKPIALPYLEDKREMLKVKHERTADCVVAGFRWFKGGGGVGSFLLGLNDERGALHHVGICSASPRRSASSSRSSSRRCGTTRSGPIPGRTGRRWPARASSGCPALRAGGTTRRTSRGSRSGSNGWWR